MAAVTPEQTQVAITGRGAVTPIGVSTWEAQFSYARPIEVQVFNVAGERNFVKPLNPNLLTPPLNPSTPGHKALASRGKLV